MKKGKEKQKPIFSKLQDVLGVFTPGTPSPEPPDQNEGPAPSHSGTEEDFPTNLPVTPPLDVSPSPPDNQIVSEKRKKMEVVTPRVIQPPEGIEVAVNSLGMTFVLIPAGTFLMGSPDYELGRNDDETQHEVSISQSFYLQTAPVTQGQWQALMGKNPSSFIQGEADCPVDSINWIDCQEFIKKLNTLGEGIYRLPMEAEWEYACRAGSTTALVNGDLTALYCDPDPNLDEMGWYCGNSDRQTHPVAQKHPNAWGLYDMHGNLAEWCQDWYGLYSETHQTDPIGPLSGPGRLIRGGSWFSSAKNCRSAARFHWPPQARSQLQTMGFRLLRET
jgi:formylglycine-generating enzyme required for sulfatase activity